MLQPYIGRLLSKNRPLFPALDLDGEGQNHTNFLEDTILLKQDKFTQIYFNEADPMMEIDTRNTNLKRRLTAYAKKHPDLCRVVSDDGERGMTFAIDKHRCTLRLTAPYSEERKQAASELAKQSGIHTKKFNTPTRRRWRENGNS